VIVGGDTAQFLELVGGANDHCPRFGVDLNGTDRAAELVYRNLIVVIEPLNQDRIANGGDGDRLRCQRELGHPAEVVERFIDQDVVKGHHLIAANEDGVLDLDGGQ
jgi:hypothetical protein